MVILSSCLKANKAWADIMEGFTGFMDHETQPSGFDGGAVKAMDNVELVVLYVQ